VYRELADDKTYLKRLRQEDVSYLYHRTGQIRKTATGELKATFRTFETEDSYWSKFYPFSNYMIVRISKNALNKIAHSRVSYEKISAKLVKQLELYGRKFDGILLDVKGNKLNSQIDLKGLVKDIHSRNYRLGIQMNLEDIDRDTFKNWTPHFCIYELVPQKPGSKTRWEPKLRQAAKVGRPFYLSVSFGEMVMDEHSLGLSDNSIGKHLKNNSVRLMSEEYLGDNLWRQYIVIDSLELDSGQFLKSGEIIHSVEPSIKMISRAQVVASKIPSFYYSGLVYNLKKAHPRYLISKSIKTVEPKLDYQLDKTHRDWFLRLRMSNHSLLGSSSGNEAAGLAINTRGFKLQSIDLGEFDNLEIKRHSKDIRYVFSLSELDALKSSSEVTLRFRPTGTTAYDAEISATAWLRPFGSSENHYYGGNKGVVRPMAALNRLATPLYQTESSARQKSF
tara:strand:+ start:172 stop:1518 length:1347 start_codon:yes stop_codon:yes gene_type:complete